MRKILFINIFLFSLLPVLSCDKEISTVRGHIPINYKPPILHPAPGSHVHPAPGSHVHPAPGSHVQPAPAKPVYVYGNKFFVENPGFYQTLLEACKRCGVRRLYPDGTYVRHYTLRNDPKRCDTWNSEGYIQIEFAEKKLPTKATVSIQPKRRGYNLPEFLKWGEPFSIQATARPINENEGFQILLFPGQLGGIRSLVVESTSSNHVKNDALDINVSYGGTERTEIINESLPKLTQKALRKSIFSCDTYTN